MDISELTIQDIKEIQLGFPVSIERGGKPLYDDKDEKKPVTVSVYGPTSDQAMKHKRKMQEWASARSMRKKQKMSGEELDRMELERLTALTADVKNLNYKGEVITKDNIYKLLKDQKMAWLRDQVAEALGDYDDFLTS